MTATPDTVGESVSSEHHVRFEITLDDRRYVHNVRTDLFLRSLGVHRRGDDVHWQMEIVKLTMRRKTARDFLLTTLEMLEDEDKWAVVGPIATQLQERGFRPRRS